MKLIYCPECQDVRKLHRELTKCKCGKSYGRYLGLTKAEIGGLSIPIGIDNVTFLHALDGRPRMGLGKPFEAFVIPVYCNTIRKTSYIETGKNEFEQARTGTNKKR